MSLEIPTDFVKLNANICKQTTNFFLQVKLRVLFGAIFFPEIMLESFGCGLYMSAAYTRVFTVYKYIVYIRIGTVTQYIICQSAVCICRTPILQLCA